MKSQSSQRRYRQIADTIAQEIESGKYATGSRLPSERDLAATLDASRATIREALVMLDIMELVEVRGGSGVYVAEPLRRPKRMGSAPGVFEILEARRLLEPGIAAIAAKEIDAAALSELRRCVLEMIEAFERGEMPDKSDRRFHMILAEATGNGAILDILMDLWDMRANSQTLRRLEERAGPERVRLRAIEDHLRLLNAISAGDARAAEQAMADHMASNIDVLMQVSSGEDRHSDADKLSRLRLSVVGTGDGTTPDPDSRD